MIALFVAISGVAGALPGKNTVNSGDIKKNGVKSIDLKNDGVTGADVKESTLDIPAAAVTKDTFGASVNAGGQVTTTTLPGTSATASGGGLYTVTFPRNIQSCAPVISVADGGPAEPARAFVSGASNVFVSTGTPPSNHAFNIIVTC